MQARTAHFGWQRTWAFSRSDMIATRATVETRRPAIGWRWNVAPISLSCCIPTTNTPRNYYSRWRQCCVLDYLMSCWVLVFLEWARSPAACLGINMWQTAYSHLPRMSFLDISCRNIILDTGHLREPFLNPFHSSAIQMILYLIIRYYRKSSIAASRSAKSRARQSISRTHLPLMSIAASPTASAC